MGFRKKAIKSVSLSLVAVTIATPIFSTVSAMENSTGENQVIETYDSKDLDEVSEYFELTSEEKQELIKNIEEYKSSEQVEERALGLSVAKKIVKIWDKLPYKVKVKIGAFGGLNYFLKILDGLTGAVDNMIYTVCKKMGMSNNVAWWVTKAILLFM